MHFGRSFPLAACGCKVWFSEVRRCPHLHLQGLVDVGNTVVVVEHDMRAVAQADWVIDLGPGAGEEGGHIVASGVPRDVADAEGSLTAHYLKVALQRLGVATE